MDLYNLDSEKKSYKPDTYFTVPNKMNLYNLYGEKKCFYILV